MEAHLGKYSPITKISHLIGWNVMEINVALERKLRCKAVSVTCCALQLCPPS